MPSYRRRSGSQQHRSPIRISSRRATYTPFLRNWQAVRERYTNRDKASKETKDVASTDVAGFPPCPPVPPVLNMLSAAIVAGIANLGI